MVVAVKVAAVHLRLAVASPPLAVAGPNLTVVPALACNIFL